MYVLEVILVRIFPAFSLIRTEYGEIRSIFPFSLRMLENEGKIRTRITPTTDTFYAVYDANIKISSDLLENVYVSQFRGAGNEYGWF